MHLNDVDRLYDECFLLVLGVFNALLAAGDVYVAAARNDGCQGWAVVVHPAVRALAQLSGNSVS